MSRSAITKKGMQGILYLTSVPKFKVVAPINKANKTEKKKQNITMGSLKIVVKKGIGPTRNSTNKVKSIRVKLSSEDRSVDIFLDSHRYGLKRVAFIAAGAIRNKLPALPSYSTPKLKEDSARSAIFMKFFCWV
jgi:hypothetical protein